MARFGAGPVDFCPDVGGVRRSAADLPLVMD